MNAVKQFQAKYGVSQTGYVGPLTRVKLNQLYGCSAPAQPATLNPVTPIVACAPHWVCNSGSCINGYKTQTLIDANYCGVSSSNATIDCPVTAPCGVLIDGGCGPAAYHDDYPLSYLLCAGGTPSPVSGTRPWTWNCVGENGGITRTCVTEMNASCGSANGKPTTSAPAGNLLCSIGTPSAVSLKDETQYSPYWEWTCNSGKPVGCRAPQVITPSCGTAAKNYPVGSTSYGSDTFCSSGTNKFKQITYFPSLAYPSQDWDCYGKNTDIPVTCTATLTVNASCGSAAIKFPPDVVASFSNFSLCNTGKATSTPGAPTAWRPSKWTCAGANGGSSVNCQATLDPTVINGA